MQTNSKSEQSFYFLGCIYVPSAKLAQVIEWTVDRTMVSTRQTSVNLWRIKTCRSISKSRSLPVFVCHK